MRRGRFDDTETAAGDAAHETCRALVPRVHSILVPTSIGALQHGHVEANLATMIMTSSLHPS